MLCFRYLVSYIYLVALAKNAIEVLVMRGTVFAPNRSIAWGSKVPFVSSGYGNNGIRLSHQCRDLARLEFGTTYISTPRVVDFDWFSVLDCSVLVWYEHGGGLICLYSRNELLIFY